MLIEINDSRFLYALISLADLVSVLVVEVLKTISNQCVGLKTVDHQRRLNINEILLSTTDIKRFVVCSDKYIKNILFVFEKKNYIMNDNDPLSNGSLYIHYFADE